MEAMSKNILRVSELIICISLFELGSTTLTVHLAPLSWLNYQNGLIFNAFSISLARYEVFHPRLTLHRQSHRYYHIPALAP
ncbi:hypothetical protein D1872_156770 [compost metagenome]